MGKTQQIVLKNKQNILTLSLILLASIVLWVRGDLGKMISAGSNRSVLSTLRTTMENAKNAMEESRDIFFILEKYGPADHARDIAKLKDYAKKDGIIVGNALADANQQDFFYAVKISHGSTVYWDVYSLKHVPKSVSDYDFQRLYQ